MSRFLGQLALFEREDAPEIDHSQTLYEHVWDLATEDCDEATVHDLRTASQMEIYDVKSDVGGWATWDNVEMDDDVWPPVLFDTKEKATEASQYRTNNVNKALDTLVRGLVSEYKRVAGKLILWRFDYTDEKGNERLTPPVPVRILKPEHDRPDVCPCDPGTACINYQAKLLVNPPSLMNLLPVIEICGPCHSIRADENTKPFTLYQKKKKKKKKKMKKT